jgi:MFS family permease
VFLVGYFVTSPLFGRMSDQGGPGSRKRLLAVGVAVWSLATIGSGLAAGAASLALARAFVGIGEASYATIAPTLIDEIAPPDRKGRWLAIFYTATPVGSALGYVVGGAVQAATHDWRMAFFVAGGPGLALALACLFLAEPERGPVKARPSILGSASELAAIPAYRMVVLGYCAYTFAMGGFAYWAPKYLHAQYGTETGRASVLFGGVTVVAGALGTIAGGNLADRLARRRGGGQSDASVTRAALVVCAWSAALGAPFALAAILAPGATGFFALTAPCELMLFLSSGPVNAAILRSVPPGLRASAMALAIIGIHALGDLWSPPLIGLVADHAPMMVAMLGVPAVFGLSALVWWRGVARVRLT